MRRYPKSHTASARDRPLWVSPIVETLSESKSRGDAVQIDLNTMPFSRYGSHLGFSSRGRDEGEVYLKKVQGINRQGHLFDLHTIKDGNRIGYRCEATPWLLRLSCNGGSVRICSPTPSSVMIRLEGCGLELFKENSEHTVQTHALAEDGGCTLVSQNSILKVHGRKGDLEQDVPHQLANVHSSWHFKSPYARLLMRPSEHEGLGEFLISECLYETVSDRLDGSFDQYVRQVEREFADWCKRMPEVSDRYPDAAKKAAYCLWSSVVSARGNYKTDAMLMSMNWMDKVWNWDNYFNSMASFFRNMEFAWSQYRLFFDHQNESGALADHITYENKTWRFTKPPIHGWALSYMMDKTDNITEEMLDQIYQPLCRWTDWWFTYRNYDGDGLPHYMHGNDSGWDNATIFDVGMPVKSPDLSAYLVLQMDVLSEVAQRLTRFSDADRWKRRADELTERMVSAMYREGRFIGIRAVTSETSTNHDSLMSYMPVVLGSRLPENIRQALVRGLSDEGRFLNRYGLATESLRSKLYIDRGYWRGNIWAPTTMLIIDGLRRCGERGLATDIARRFCDTVAKGPFYENYSPLTGEGNYCPAYTWTASVFLLLAHEYLATDSPNQ